MNFLCRPPRTEYGSIPLKQLFHVKSATPEILPPSIIYFSKLYGIYCGAEGNSSLWNFNFERVRGYLEKLITGFFFFFHSCKNKRSINFFFFLLKIERETGSNWIECAYIFEIKFKSLCINRSFFLFSKYLRNIWYELEMLFRNYLEGFLLR